MLAVLVATGTGTQTGGAPAGVAHVVPAAHATGVSGSHWTTDLKALNTGPEVASYRLLAVPNGETLGEPVATSGVRTLAPGASEHLKNVLFAELGLADFSGSLFIEVLSGAPTFDSRTWSSREDGSVVGQRVAPMKRADAAGAEAFIPLIDGDFRVNLYVAAWAPAAVTAALVDEAGLELARWQRVLAAGQVLQLNDFVSQLDPGRRALGILLEASGPVSTGASVVDNRGAQDPTWFEGIRTGTTEAWAVAASSAGANGSRWRTDAWVRNPTDEERDVRIVVWTDGRPHASTATFAARRILFVRDVVGQLAKVGAGAGAVQVSSLGGVQVATRTYSTTIDGSTAGQAIPPVAEGLGPGETGVLFGLEQTAESRTNLGYLNAGADHSVTFTRIVSDDRAPALDRRTITLGPAEWYQENDVLAPLYEGLDARVEVALLDGSDPSANLVAYASTVANEPALPRQARHNDPAYQPAHILHPPDEEPLPRELTVMLPGDVPLKLVLVPAGTTFLMGAVEDEWGSTIWERPRHPVTIAHDVYIGRYEVTQGQWQAVMGSNPAGGYGVGAALPVYRVSWNDIAGPDGFVARLDSALGTTAFRLPSEAEWECAARAGTTAEFSFPAPAGWDRECGLFPAAEPFVWWCGSEWPLSGPMGVGEKLPNAWGLCDVHGNVWELVEDVFHPGFTEAPSDGSAWVEPPGPTRVLRGGGWNAAASYCRSATRIPLDPDHKCFNQGFRIAADAHCRDLASPSRRAAASTPP